MRMPPWMPDMGHHVRLSGLPDETVRPGRVAAGVRLDGLAQQAEHADGAAALVKVTHSLSSSHCLSHASIVATNRSQPSPCPCSESCGPARSEERRVGKECRTRW